MSENNVVRLNPYSNGMLTQENHLNKYIMKTKSLNPYSNGMLTQKRQSFSAQAGVSLNPYSNGMLTQSFMCAHFKPSVMS